MLLALCASVAQAQVKFSVAYKKVSATQVDIVFTGKADAGWHIYSTNIPDGGPTPASFGIDEAKGVKLAGTLNAGAGATPLQDPPASSQRVPGEPLPRPDPRLLPSNPKLLKMLRR